MDSIGEHILLAVVLLLALYGCAELIRRLACFVMTPTKGTAGILVIPVAGHREDIEYIIRSAAVREKWYYRRGTGPVLLVDMGMDDETRLLAERICKELGNVDIYSEKRAGEFVPEGLQNQ